MTESGFNPSEHDKKYGKYGVDWHYDNNGAVVKSAYSGEYSNQNVRKTERVVIEETQPEKVLQKLIRESEKNRTENGSGIITFSIANTEFLFDSEKPDEAIIFIGAENDEQARRVAQGLSQTYIKNRA